jgi:DNA-binding CsgD family transcriptional regulator
MSTRNGTLFVASVADITRRNQAVDEDRLIRRARERLDQLDQLGFSGAVVRQDGTVAFINKLMKGYSAQFGLTGAKVQLPNAPANKALMQTLCSLDADANQVYSFPITAEKGHPPAICHLLPMKGQSGGMLGVLLMRTIGDSDAAPIELVQGLFGMAPAEAKVAVLISAGRSPKDAAEVLGVSEGNVRTTLKHVCTRLGVSRQSELAALFSKLTLR